MRWYAEFSEQLNSSDISRQPEPVWFLDTFGIEMGLPGLVLRRNNYKPIQDPAQYMFGFRVGSGLGQAWRLRLNKLDVLA
ncbi:hypothetical protein CKAN_00531000 [Cinnamomum micranthum f. kanehirae]|uniref:Uncharacterized protein n=1 Tax=Cinnamomum micranthum f. kanehirae TaxID=337451 RepID=A0A443NEE0_9MAGN|nr:hypothetical protein CKAN_00531000 [Cinnamomum micranthum f. kanehirae]